VNPSSVIRIAAGAFVGMLLIASALVATTSLRAEDLGPVIVYGVAAVSVFLLWFAPIGRLR
jgi:hypothetical protein